MKTSADNKTIPDRVWYYLLDFNDRDGFKTLFDLFDKKRLMDLTRHELTRLFRVAVKSDMKTLNTE